jgi:hypothetical protein
VRGATLQILATCPVVKTFIARSPLSFTLLVLFATHRRACGDSCGPLLAVGVRALPRQMPRGIRRTANNWVGTHRFGCGSVGSAQFPLNRAFSSHRPDQSSETSERPGGGKRSLQRLACGASQAAGVSPGEARSEGEPQECRTGALWARSPAARMRWLLAGFPPCSLQAVAFPGGKSGRNASLPQVSFEPGRGSTLETFTACAEHPDLRRRAARFHSGK